MDRGYERPESYGGRLSVKIKRWIVGALRLLLHQRDRPGHPGHGQNLYRIGVFVVLIAGLLSIFLANTILIPLKEVTSVAESMAAGNYKIKSRKDGMTRSVSSRHPELYGG
jgi:signal transduction histidine kinase